MTDNKNMRNNTYRKLLYLSGLAARFLSSAALGADSLSLAQALEETHEHSPQIKLAKAREEEARGKKQESYSGFLPTLSANAYHFTAIKYQSFSMNFLPNAGPTTISFVSPSTSLKFSATLPLFDGLRNVEQYRAAAAAQEAATQDREWQEFNVDQDVRGAFYQTLAAQELDQVAEENIHTLEDHYGHVQARRKGGVATSYDVLRVEVQLDEARTEKMKADDNVVLARQHLARLMGSPEDDRPLAGTLPIPQEAAKLNLLKAEAALKDRKDLQALALQEKAFDYNSSAAHSWLIPSIGLMADFERYNNVNKELFASDPYKTDYDVGVYLRWNIFDGGASLARASQAEAQNQQALYREEMEAQRVPETLEGSRRRYIYGLALFRTAASDIKKSEESVRQAKEGFRQGTRTVSEQLDAQLDLFRARANKVTAQLSAAQAWIELETALGRNLGHDDFK